jgi:methionine sulfoxide reductase catalytic subunit
VPEDPTPEDQTEGPAGAEAGGSTCEPPASGAAPRALRVTRRRLLVVGGAALAGVAATVAGVRLAGGTGGAPEESGGAPDDPGSAGGASGVPGGDFPVLSVEPPPDVPAGEWVLKVDGLVDTELTIDRSAWARLARSSVTADFHCVTGWTADHVRWQGVAPSVLLDRAGVRPEAESVVFRAYGHLGGEYSSSVALGLVTAPGAVLADTLDGVPLPARHGGPLRLVVPSQLGYKSVKWVVRMEVTDVPVPGYWEQRGYPQDAPVGGG